MLGIAGDGALDSPESQVRDLKAPNLASDSRARRTYGRRVHGPLYPLNQTRAVGRALTNPLIRRERSSFPLSRPSAATIKSSPARQPQVLCVT
jgi:hypothetical protein